jgi:hypothetical protein
MIRRTSATTLAFLLLPALMVSGEATAQSAESAPATITASPAVSATSTSPARATGSVCSNNARRGFAPAKATVGKVGRNITVYAMGRGSGGVPLPPPLTSSGKNSFAWDKYGPKPGSAYGNVRFTAHTFPDGSALGNRLLTRLKVGARIVLRGENATICYRVKRRMVVSPTQLSGYYSTTGKPRLAIVVCSGKRLGPGQWTTRTIWFARPSTF